MVALVYEVLLMRTSFYGKLPTIHQEVKK